MLTLRVSFSDIHGGEVIDFAAGENFDEAHPMVANHREFFGLPPAAPSGNGKRRAARPRRSSANVDARRHGPVAAPGLASPSLFRPDPEDFYTQRSARHEGAHAAAVYLLGWEVIGSELFAVGGGHCGARSPANLDRDQHAKEFATILYAARAHAGWSATDSYCDDDRQAYDAIARVTSDPRQAGMLRDALRAQAEQLEASSKFRRLARAVAAALLERGKLGERELESLLREAERDARRAGEWV